MRVLLLGATGLLGSHLAARLPQSFTTVAPRPRAGVTPSSDVVWLTSAFEASDAASCAAVVDEADADVIVNAVGIAGGSPGDAPRLEAVNARFPQQLAGLAVTRGARVVHISTDGVFSGARGNYREDDTPDPQDMYGRSKLAGELASPHLTLRTSFFGRTSRGSGLIEWLVAQRGHTVDGFVDYRFTGIAAAVLADLIAVAVERRLAGLYHVGGQAFTKYELLTRAAERLNLDVEVRPVERGRVDRTLDSSRFAAESGRPPASLDESLAILQPCLISSRR